MRTSPLRWLLALLLIAWFAVFIPTSDTVVYVLATAWLLYLLGGLLSVANRR